MHNMPTKIEEKLDTANDKLDLILQWKAGFEERCIAHRAQTNEVRVVLFGKDNKDGLVRCVNGLNQCKESLSRWRNFWMYVLRIVVATFIISLAGWLLFIYREHSNSKKVDGAESSSISKMESK